MKTKCPFGSLEQFAEFVFKLNERMPDLDKSCDHTLQRSMSVLTEMGFGGLARISARHWLQDHGGFCDCEVMLNVVPWNDTGGIDPAEWRKIK